MSTPLDYAEAVAQVEAAKAAVMQEFLDAKAARRADPYDPDVRERYIAARENVQQIRAVERSGRATSVGGDAVVDVPQED